MDVLDELGKRGAILTGKHFVYKSGTHGPNYINMDPLFPDVNLLLSVCAQLCNDLLEWKSYETVVAAATGGIPLAVLSALQTQWSGVSAVWADKRGDDFAFERAGFVNQIVGKTVLIVEDLLNTGDTTKKIIDLVRGHGGNVVGVSVICNRGPHTAESLDVPELFELSKVDFQVFPADTCSLCAEGRPIVEDIGHGNAYKEANPDYSGGYVKLLS